MVKYYPLTEGFILTSPFGPRGGGYHRGNDYGREGGSANNPVYAVASGVVAHAGPASGFGGPHPAGWIVIDHDNSTYTSVYGHVITEVSVGTRVSAGQRIGRINPNKQTNGLVDPHLHFEIHPNRWAANSQIDPTPWLSGALYPSQNGGSDVTQTTFGIDISEHQGDYNFVEAKKQGIAFAILRLNDGTYADRWFKRNLQKALSAGLVVSSYWYLRAPSEGSTISSQVDVIDAQFEGRKDISVWIDVESTDRLGNKLLSSSDVHNARNELLRRGYKVAGVYSGAWYWERMPGGEPSMEGLGYLWVSNYGRDLQGDYRVLYPGNDSARWAYPLGNRYPDILQYGSKGYVSGQHVDINAYRGDINALRKLFGYNTTTYNTLFERMGMSENIKSRVNSSKSFSPETMLALIDQAQWENRVLLKALLDKLDMDTSQILRDAYNKDNVNNPEWRNI